MGLGNTSPKAIVSADYYNSRNTQLRAQMSNKSPEGTKGLAQSAQTSS
jgi:hypothetical protein